MRIEGNLKQGICKKKKKGKSALKVDLISNRGFVRIIIPISFTKHSLHFDTMHNQLFHREMFRVRVDYWDCAGKSAISRALVLR